MTKKKPAPVQTTDLAGMAKKIEGESDRGAALIIAAWVDDALGDLLKAYLVQEAGVIEEMFTQMARSVPSPPRSGRRETKRTQRTQVVS